MAFHGTAEHTLDVKNRLTVPARFRSALSGQVFLVKGLDPCISVHPADAYNAMAERALAGHNPLSREVRDLRRVLYGGAMPAELDGAGRIMVPAAYLRHAGIEGREVMIVGTGDSLELWDRRRWENYEPDLHERGPELTQSLGHPA